LRLITWNVARRAERLPEQATALAAREPDVVALQEVTRRTEPLWMRAFELNTPRRELPSGETISFARDTHGRLRPGRGSEWDAAELGVVPGLRELGYLDVFRALHGYAAREPSGRPRLA
jgi:hypothetical protein